MFFPCACRVHPQGNVQASAVTSNQNLNGREAASDHKKVALIMPPNGLIEGYGGAVIDPHMTAPKIRTHQRPS